MHGAHSLHGPAHSVRGCRQRPMACGRPSPRHLCPTRHHSLTPEAVVGHPLLLRLRIQAVGARHAQQQAPPAHHQNDGFAQGEHAAKVAQQELACQRPGVHLPWEAGQRGRLHVGGMGATRSRLWRQSTATHTAGCNPAGSIPYARASPPAGVPPPHPGLSAPAAPPPCPRQPVQRVCPPPPAAQTPCEEAYQRTGKSTHGCCVRVQTGQRRLEVPLTRQTAGSPRSTAPRRALPSRT